VKQTGLSKIYFYYVYCDCVLIRIHNKYIVTMQHYMTDISFYKSSVFLIYGILKVIV